jgi:hypothetical protein
VSDKQGCAARLAADAIPGAAGANVADILSALYESKKKAHPSLFGPHFCLCVQLPRVTTEGAVIGPFGFPFHVSVCWANPSRSLGEVVRPGLRIMLCRRLTGRILIRLHAALWTLRSLTDRRVRTSWDLSGRGPVLQKRPCGQPTGWASPSIPDARSTPSTSNGVGDSIQHIREIKICVTSLVVSSLHTSRHRIFRSSLPSGLRPRSVAPP